MKYAIYSRKSVYTGKGESVENQIGMCKKYIFSKFDGVSESDITVYEDEGFSAQNTNRPRFQQMLKDIKQKKFDYVVCYRLDRISRNVSDFSSLIEDLNDRNISFICIKEEFDTSKPMGKAMMYIASVFAQLERETIAERVRDNMLMLARAGRWLGGTTPTGYTSEKIQEIVIDGKIKTACKLQDNPEELRVIDLMFEKFLEYRTVSGVSKYLIRQNIKSRAGNFYSWLGIKEILQNPVYCIADQDAFSYFTDHNADVCFEGKDCSAEFGLISYNKRDYKKKHAPRQAIDKWIIAIGKHRGRVTGNKWVTVQRILEDNIPDGKKPSKIHNGYSLLSGLIYCEKCGCRIFAKPRGSRLRINKKGGGTITKTSSLYEPSVCGEGGASCAKRANPELFDYICQSKLRGGVELCGCQNINGCLADDMVCEYLISYTNENSDIYRLLEKLKHGLQSQANKDPIEIVNTSIKKRYDEIGNLINTLSQNNFGNAFVQCVSARISELDNEIAQLNEERDRLQKDVNLIADKETQIDMIIAALSNLKDNFKSLSVYDKRSLIKLLVKKIVWDGNDFHIFIDEAQ